ncbi:MutS protein msh4 [Ceratobasidium sp. 394]|nr:MutS protein msh4 [Ceratobasidium sp. 394]
MTALDKTTGRCVLFQIPDCQAYVKTLHHLQLHNPSAILVPDTFMPMESSTRQKTSLLVDSMQEDFGADSMTEFVPVARKYWDDQNGLEAINRLIVNNGRKLGHLWQFRASTMMIDCETARNLELVQSSTVRKNKNSLFGLLNHTFIPMAHRLLCVNILAPITDQTAIDHRLDVVQELVNNEEKYTAIRDALKTLKKIDLDKLIAQLTTSENRPVGGYDWQRQRLVIRSLPGIVKALQGCRSDLLRTISGRLDNERVKSIDEVVSQGLNDEAIAAGGGGGFGGSGFGATTKKIYAVRANFNRSLDVARETYRENYQENVFVFTLKKGDVPQNGKQPATFINVSAEVDPFAFGKKHNARLRDSLNEALILIDQVVKALVEKIVEDVDVSTRLRRR